MKKIGKRVSSTKKIKKNKKHTMAKTALKANEVKENLVHNTIGATMPDPYARNRPIRKDVRFAFR